MQSHSQVCRAVLYVFTNTCSISLSCSLMCGPTSITIPNHIHPDLSSPLLHVVKTPYDSLKRFLHQIRAENIFKYLCLLFSVEEEVKDHLEKAKSEKVIEEVVSNNKY